MWQEELTSLTQMNGQNMDTKIAHIEGFWWDQFVNIWHAFINHQQALPIWAYIIEVILFHENCKWPNGRKCWDTYHPSLRR